MSTQPARLVTVHKRGEEKEGTVVAFTEARRPDGERGYCIAVVSGKRLMRLAALHGSASPFWANNQADGLAIGSRVEYSERGSSAAGEYPHKNEDLWCGSIVSLGEHMPIYPMLEPLATRSLQSVWPTEVMIDGARTPRVRAGSNVPSLIVLRGTIRSFEADAGQTKAGRASLRLGQEPAEELVDVRVVCPAIRATLVGSSELLNAERLLILGLARANKRYAEKTGEVEACEILLIGWAGKETVTGKRSTREPQLVDKDEQERRRQRAIRFGL